MSVVVCPGVGGPGTAVAIEELAVLGVGRIIAINVAGSIDPALTSGSVMLVDSALCGDGTSPHYCSNYIARPGTNLTNAIAQRLRDCDIGFSRGTIWSTDAIYRETPALLADSRGRGAVAVDMETAAVLSVSASLGIEAAAIVVAADVTLDDWRPPLDMKSIHATLRSLSQIAIACLVE